MHHVTTPHAAMLETSAAPTDNLAFSALMQQHVSQNATLLRYVYPTAARLEHLRHPNPNNHWVPFTANCKPANDCYCFHVSGDMSFSRDPMAWQKCMHHHTWPDIGSCPKAQHNEALRSCGCLTDAVADISAMPESVPPRQRHRCLYTDMRPSKLLAVISAARAAGVTHIVEEGRYGGLTALMYALHGFHVTSIEFLPLTGPKAALSQLAPHSITQLEGDGAKLVPSVIDAMSDAAAARTLVIFDGEKRLDAWATYRKLRGRVAMAVFDDTDNDLRGPPLRKTNDKDWERVRAAAWEQSPFISQLNASGQVWWSTWDESFASSLEREDAALRLLEPLQALKSKSGGHLKWWGGVKGLNGHFTIVRGEAWR